MTKMKILYVEDEPNLAKLVIDSLEAKGIEVHHISHGLKAVEAFHQTDPDVCVLDVMLPGKDGFQIGREIRASDPGIPILFLTAKNSTEDVLQGFDHGGNDYVRKPFNIDELIARLHNLNRREGQTDVPREADWHIGKFTLSPLKQELKIDGVVISLTHRENELLKLLIARKAEDISRKEILKSIWGDDSFFNSRNLDVYISKIRGYLSRDPSVQLLTLKGVGYRLIS